MKATDFVKLLPELRAWLEGREAVLESIVIDQLAGDPHAKDTYIKGGQLVEIRHLKNQLAHIERTSQEASEVCLG